MIGIGQKSFVVFGNSLLPETKLIIDGITLTGSQKNLINGYVKSLIDAGLWAKMPALYGNIGTSITHQGRNWITPGTHDLTENATGTYTYNSEGFILGGNINSYMHTGFNCLNDLTPNCSVVGVMRYPGNGPLFGGTSSQRLVLYSYYSTDIFAANGNRSIESAVQPLHKNFMVANIRISATDFRIFLDDTQLGQETGAITSLPNIESTIGLDSTNYMIASGTYGGTPTIVLLAYFKGINTTEYEIFRTLTMSFLYSFEKLKYWYIFNGDSNTEAPALTNFATQVGTSEHANVINNGHSGWSMQYQSNTGNSFYYNRAAQIKQWTTADNKIIFCYGTNDIGYNCAFAGYNAATFNTHYRAALDEFINNKGGSGSDIIILEIPYQTQAARDAFWGPNINNIQQSDVDVYLGHCSQIATDYGATFIPLYHEIEPNAATLLNADGVHLTQAGQDYVAQQILNVL